MKMVLQKYIAQSGSYSRRQAEALILAGRVKLNGQNPELGARVDENDEILIDKKPLHAAPEKVYLMLNKPVGYTCTHRQFAGEQNIFDLVRLPFKVSPVGRLDKDSSGLLLLTNDGALLEKLSHPRFEHEKIYEVKIDGQVSVGSESQNLVKKLTNGIELEGEDGGKVKARRAEYLQNNRYLITLTTGKKRQLRRMFQTLGRHVVSLKRTMIATLELGDLPVGKWRYLTEKEIANLKR
jgi:pseudouridine synthase